MGTFAPSIFDFHKIHPWRFSLIVLGIMILVVPGTSLPAVYPRSVENVVYIELPQAVKVCRPALWYDPVVFILLNHIIHLFSIKTWPDETLYDTAANLFLAFCMPYAGIWRCYVYFNALPVFLGSDDLQKAKWAGALCMVARGRDWEPEPGKEISVRLTLAEDVLKEDPRDLGLNETQTEALLSNDETGLPSLGLRHAMFSVERVYSYYRISTRVPMSYPCIHGQHKLPKGYVWLEVPPNAIVSPLLPEVQTVLASNPKLLMGIAAMTQLLFACLTLFWGQGPAQKKSGYAAYSLTVIPYAIMSFLNFIVASLIPDYSTRYLVRNSIMEEAESRGGRFSATVGTLQPGTEVPTRYQKFMTFQRAENCHGQKVITAVEDTGVITSSEEKHSVNAGAVGSGEPMKWIVETGRKIECAYAPADGAAFRGLLGTIKMPTTAAERLEEAGSLSEDIRCRDIISVPSVDIYLTDPNKLYKSIWAAKFLKRSQLRVPFLLMQVLPYIVIGILTKFRPGESTVWERFWMMYWLVTGQLCGGLIEPFKQAALRRQRLNMDERLSVLLPNVLRLLSALSLVLTPSIVIFIMVWKQIMQSGICKIV